MTTKTQPQKKKTKPSPKTDRRPWQRLVAWLTWPRCYALAAVAILLLTTAFWSLLSARLQASNADQLVNVYLFENSRTLHGALIPAQHTFLLKWPLFWLVKTLGSSIAAFEAVTVGTTLITVAALASILYSIERRLLVFGTLCLALASVLVLVPAQPYAGGLLPVNLAMLATRNLEYIVYIGALALLARGPRFRSKGFWLAGLALGLLIASDKLFLTVSLGGALLALICYGLFRRWGLVALAVKWLMAGVIAAGVSALVLWLLGYRHITHLVNPGSLDPYSVIHNVHSLVLGGIFAATGLLTNFGANPAFDATIIRHMPHEAFTRLVGRGGPAFVINGAILLVGLFWAGRLLITSLGRRHHKAHLDEPAKLSLMLLWTSLAAIGAFVVTNHYYAVDARYLTIGLFGIFIAAATVVRHKQWPAKGLGLAGGIFTIGLLFGLMATTTIYHQQRAALATVNGRNELVAQAALSHPESVLAGDYWRVLPTKLAAGGHLNILPLSSCLQPRQVSSSTAWQSDLNTHSFAYLLSLDSTLTDYPHCTLDQVIAAYGRPNASALIAGSIDEPQEQLLFYDRGAHKSAPVTQLKKPSTVLPVSLGELPNTNCSGPTIMNIVAHQDDDLLFMNPDLLHSIHAGHCIRTIYITAGDAGHNQFYWLSREQGSEAAYESMAQLGKSVWVQRIVKLGDHQFVTIANPRGNMKLSLIFVHLPDGGLHGQGFGATNFESLERLEDGHIATMNSIDAQSAYTASQLTTALVSLMQIYHPAEIRTQANYVSHFFPDHSDHLAVGRLVKRAYSDYETQQYEGRVAIPLTFYIGYPVREWPENVTGVDLQDSEKAFFAYAQFDGGVCGSIERCAHTPTYYAYLHRQYTIGY